MARVVLAMSGGVDSSVAAWLLREAGHEVVGLFMRHGGVEEACEPGPERPATEGRHRQGCCTAADATDARRVAAALDIPFYAVDFDDQFGRIVDYFVAEYTAARTPNPCIQCNTWLKFGKLFEYADSVRAEFVATGHHARVAAAGRAGVPALCRGSDAGKDQSYVLFGVDRDRLRRMLLPVGEYTKEGIRRLAERAGLRTARKAESQEICFIPSGDHAAFVRARSSRTTPGEIVTTAGTVVGRHDGLARFTVGQRKGLGVALGEPRYVVRLEAATGRVVLGSREELARSELSAAETNWLVDQPARAFPCRVKIRYRSPAVAAVVEPLSGRRMRVRFSEPCYGVAPGQAAVCYEGDRVLGGGWIES